MHETVGKIRVLENSNFNLLERMQGSRTETVFSKKSAAFSAAAMPFRVIRQPARYSFMLAAAFLPSPIARMTVAAPSTMSPPAHTFVLLVACLSSTTM